MHKTLHVGLLIESMPGPSDDPQGQSNGNCLKKLTKPVIRFKVEGEK